jgi:hypothetical protein
MSTRRFAALAERLLRGGLPPRRVRRIIAELDAHFDDLVEELRTTGLSAIDSEHEAATRLGPEDALAASILSRPELHSWARRWPGVAFGMLPVLSLPAQFVLSMFVTVQIFSLATHHLGFSALHPGPVPWICAGLQAYALWIAPMLAAGAASYFAVRQRAPLLWPIAAGIVIALVGAMTNASLDWSPTAPHGMLTGGIGFPPRDFSQWLRIALTLLAGLSPLLLQMRSKERGTTRADLHESA